MQKYRTIVRVKGHGPDLELANECLELQDGRTIDIADQLEQSRSNLQTIDLRIGQVRELVGSENYKPGIRRQYTRREREFVLECAAREDWSAICDRYGLSSERLARDMATRFRIQNNSEGAISISYK
jgi:hypothetical protein